MQLVQIASEKVTTRVENISKQLDGLDARVEGNEREYYRDRAKQNGEGKHE